MTLKALNHFEFNKLMNIFHKLMFHPLTVKPIDCEEQYIIEFIDKDFIVNGFIIYYPYEKTEDFEKLLEKKGEKKDEINVIFEYTLIPKLNSISPSFATAEDARQAINDIGEANLIHMFKTLKGIYEDE